MVAPLLGALGLLGFMGATQAGGTMINDFFAGRRQAGRAQSFGEALDLASVGTGEEMPRPSPGFVGPGAEETELDIGLLGETLARQGEPGGIDMLTGQAGATTDFMRKQQLAREGHEAALRRQELANQGSMDVARFKAQGDTTEGFINDQGIFVPLEPIAVGTPAWQKLAVEGGVLGDLRQIATDMGDILTSSGTESLPGAAFQRAQSLQQRMMFALNKGLKLGALDEGSVTQLMQLIPNITRNTPELIANEATKVGGISEMLNSLIGAYESQAQFSAELPRISRLPSRRAPPEGFHAVDEGQINPTGGPEFGPVLPALQGPRRPIQGPIDTSGRDIGLLGGG